MSLSTDLQAQQKQFLSQVSHETQAMMTQATVDLANSGILDQSLKIGDTIPEFTLPNAAGQVISSQDLLAQGPIVITFYRGGWCPYCNLELRALQQALKAVEATGAILVAISPETPDNSLTTQQKNDLEFPVLSDNANHVARQFGLVFQLPAALQAVYSEFGIDLATHNGNSHFELPIPATYVVQANGKIAFAFADADYTKRANPTDIINALTSLQQNSQV